MSRNEAYLQLPEGAVRADLVDERTDVGHYLVWYNAGTQYGGPTGLGRFATRKEARARAKEVGGNAICFNPGVYWIPGPMPSDPLHDWRLETSKQGARRMANGAGRSRP